MRLLSSQVRYAICGIFDLAFNADAEPVQLRVIGARQGIPARYLEQIFQRLRRGGLVRGKRGPGGGYVLSRAGSEITLLDVVEAVEGPLEVAESGSRAEADRTTRSFAGESGYRPDFLWPVIGGQFASVLESTTIEALCQDAARQGVRRVSSEYLSYDI
jgi:Rrf2 family iron-sulfur cluster assembly transcriptional regulator